MIKAHNVFKTYPNGVEDVKKFSYEFTKGNNYLIKGSSGAGKSTLLNLLGLIDPNFEGDIKIENVSIKDIKEKDAARIRNEMFGFIFQEYALVENESVYENIKIPLYYSNVKRSEHKNKINNIIKLVQLEDKVNEKVKNLSGGQRQRVAIARALVNDPQVIFADEPFSSLDKELETQLFEITVDYVKGDKLLIMVSHDVDNKIFDEFVKLEIENGNLIL